MGLSLEFISFQPVVFQDDVQFSFELNLQSILALGYGCTVRKAEINAGRDIFVGKDTSLHGV